MQNGRPMRRAWPRISRVRGFPRALRAVRILARDERIPRPLRWIAGIGLLPIPGPVDEVLLITVAPVFAAFYREPMREAWSRSAALDAHM
jgi:hypothetical protein